MIPSRVDVSPAPPLEPEPSPPAAAAASTSVPSRVLPVIVLAQLFGVSPWFAVNAVMPDLQRLHGWPPEALATLSSSVQLGFIGGTLVFAVIAIADRWDTRRVFLLCACAAGACTLAAMLAAGHYPLLMACRLATGFFLAGIYPVGMKLASQWFPGGLGSALGWLVGALVLGTASPHLLRAIGAQAPWEAVFLACATAVACAGVAVSALLPARPVPTSRAALSLAGLLPAWRSSRVRASVLGYFGHMWELYTLWVLVPWIIATRLPDAQQVSFVAFVVIGAGALGCVAGGVVARRRGSAHVATSQLAVGGLCALASPWLLSAPLPLFLMWLFVWGVCVAGDSPQFSALTAVNAPPQRVGSVLTLTNCAGFALSALSIELFVGLVPQVPLSKLLPWLALGPAFGILAMRPLLREERSVPAR